MHGINTENIDAILNNVNNYNEEISVSINQIIESLEELHSIFKSNDFEEETKKINTMSDNFKQILSVIDNYHTILENVKKSYIEEDISLSESIKKSSTDF